jgi:hypothetical protein
MGRLCIRDEKYNQETATFPTPSAKKGCSSEVAQDRAAGTGPTSSRGTISGRRKRERIDVERAAGWDRRRDIDYRVSPGGVPR